MIVALVAVFAAGAAVSAPGARASRISLLADVKVGGNSIYLSDLLPPDASAAMRNSAQSVLIGLAPQPGSARILDGELVANLIGSANSANEIDIPRQIVVRRVGRTITRDEVITAIRAALKHSGLPDADLQPDDLRVFPSVTVSSSDAKVEVRRIDFDETLNQAKFLMSERGALPFLVTAQFRDASLIEAATQDSVSVASHARNETRSAASSAAVSGHPEAAADQDDEHMIRLTSGALINATRVQGPTLVQAGKAATLFLNSGTMQMLLDVTAIDRGSLHQVIRVRLPGTGKVLRAQVVGDRRLEAAF